MKNRTYKLTSNYGFTIVELLVTVVIIGILVSITIVSYTNITLKANQAALQSDLSNAKTQLAVYQAENGTYPTKLDNSNCPQLPKPDTNYCLKPSNDTTLDYSPVSANDFNLRATKNNQTYFITSNTSPADDADNWITVGNQKWAKTNANVGTMVTGTTAQTNNSILEKYCYNNNEANCTTYGVLYQWDEAMQYVVTEGVKGICPVNSHIPSDGELKTLEMYLGMTQAQADATDWRGTDQGTKIKTNGTSGLNLPLAGYRYTDGLFYDLSSDANLWSSSESGTSAWYRDLGSGYATVRRYPDTKAYGFSVRCLGN